MGKLKTLEREQKNAEQNEQLEFLCYYHRQLEIKPSVLCSQ